MHLTLGSRRMKKQGEINKGSTTGNGIGFSSLEIQTGNVSELVTLWTPLWHMTALFCLYSIVVYDAHQIFLLLF